MTNEIRAARVRYDAAITSHVSALRRGDSLASHEAWVVSRARLSRCNALELAASSAPHGWDAIEADGPTGEPVVNLDRSDDVPNLDVMDADELRETADRLACGDMLPNLPADVRSQVVRYCSLRLVAINHRLAGRIQSSLIVGHQLDAIYQQIPESYRW